jgi:cytochrome c556
VTRWMQTIGALVGGAMLALPLAAQAQPPAPPGPPPGGMMQPPPEGKDADPIIQYRLDVMQSVGHQTAAIGAIMQKKVPESYSGNIALHAQTLALLAQEAVKAFETRQPGGTAKPEVWDNWKEFSEKLMAMSTAASNLAKKASAGPVTVEDVRAVQGACRDCHQNYRQRKQ